MIETEDFAIFVAQRGRHQNGTVISKGDESAIESSIEVCCEQDAVEDIETLGVALAIGPGFDVARAKQLGHGEAGDGAAALPIVYESGAEDILANPLHDETFGLSGPRQARRQRLSCRETP